MAITHTPTVESLKVLNDSDNIVFSGRAVINSVDDSVDPAINVRTEFTFELDTEGVTPSSPGFIAFDDLTEANILTWINTTITESQSVNENRIGKIKNPPTPLTVDRDLPWEVI